MTASALAVLQISSKCKQDQMRMRQVAAAICRLMTVISSTPLDPTAPVVFNHRSELSDIVFLQRASAEAVLKELQAQPDAWTKVDTILERSTTEQTKFFALQV